jgi:hypothetical protein
MHLKNLGLILQRNLRPARRLPGRTRRTRAAGTCLYACASGDTLAGRDTSKEASSLKKSCQIERRGALLIASGQLASSATPRAQRNGSKPRNYQLSSPHSKNRAQQKNIARLARSAK